MIITQKTPTAFAVAAALALLSAGCSLAPALSREPVEVPVAAELSPVLEDAFEEDLSQLMAQMRHDLDKFSGRERQRPGHNLATNQQVARPRVHAPMLREQVVISSLRLPILGLKRSDLDDNFGESRDRGRRRHRGIDIFAPKGAEVVAVADGSISYIGTQGKGGRCLWLVTDGDLSFYYAHLDRWAPGLYEGMQVKEGDILGYVGKTGNAARSSPHLHFQVVENDTPINPYPLLTQSGYIRRAAGATLSGGFGLSGGSQ